MSDELTFFCEAWGRRSHKCESQCDGCFRKEHAARLERAEKLLREIITTCEVHKLTSTEFFDLWTDVEAARVYFREATLTPSEIASGIDSSTKQSAQQSSSDKREQSDTPRTDSLAAELTRQRLGCNSRMLAHAMQLEREVKQWRDACHDARNALPSHAAPVGSFALPVRYGNRYAPGVKWFFDANNRELTADEIVTALNAIALSATEERKP